VTEDGLICDARLGQRTAAIGTARRQRYVEGFVGVRWRLTMRVSAMTPAHPTARLPQVRRRLAFSRTAPPVVSARDAPHRVPSSAAHSRDGGAPLRGAAVRFLDPWGLARTVSAAAGRSARAPAVYARFAIEVQEEIEFTC